MLKRKANLALVLSLSASIVLTGCQGGLGNRVSNSDIDPAFKEQVDFFSDSGKVACGAGALVGGVLGAVVAKNKGASTEETIAAGVGGAAVGCAVAGGANYYLEKNRKAYAKKEDQLNATIADAKEVNQKLSQGLAKAQSAIARDKTAIADLEKQLKSKAISQAEADKQLASMKKRANGINAMLKGAKERRDALVASYNEYRAEKGSSQLDKEIKKLNQQIVKLESIGKDYDVGVLKVKG